jgi:hypothetical protein
VQAPVAVKLAIAAGNPHPHPPLPRTRRSLRHPHQTLARLRLLRCHLALPHAARRLDSNALDSPGLESYGLPGPWQWITVYTNSGHAWIVAAGIALDTADYGGAPIPAGTGPRWRRKALASLRDGTPYVARHPEGL